MGPFSKMPEGLKRHFLCLILLALCSSISYATANTTKFLYDCLGRVTRTEYPPTEFEGSGGQELPTYTHTGYDSLGRRIWQSEQVAQSGEPGDEVPDSEIKDFE